MTPGKSAVFLTILILFQGMFTDHAIARDDLVPGSRYTSARAAAMGDAFLPLGDDVASGLFYNPANLSKIRSMELESSNFSLNVNSPFVSKIDFGSVNLPFLGSFLPTLTTASPQFVGGGGAFLVDFGMPGFACGILMQTQVGAQRNADGTISYRSRYQIIPAVGTGLKLFGGLLRMGYSLQWVNQAVGKITAASSTSLAYTDGNAEGQALSHNFGLSATLPITMLPTLNLVVRNAFGAHYAEPTYFSFAPETSVVPAPEAMTFDGSFSIQRHLGKGGQLNIVGEFKDILGQSPEVLGRISVGAEIAIRRKVFFRGGWGRGYPAAGIGFKGEKAELSFTWYTAEIGTSYLSQGDMRFMMQYQVRSF